MLGLGLGLGLGFGQSIIFEPSSVVENGVRMIRKKKRGVRTPVEAMRITKKRNFF